MKQIKRIVLVGLICLAWQANGYADTAWSGSPNPVPNDGETYYIDSGTVTPGGAVTIRGILEIRTGGTLTINSITVTIDGGELRIVGGTVNNDTDGIITIENGGTLTIRNGTLDNGSNPGGPGTINIGNGTLTTLGGSFLNGNSSDGRINLSHPGALIVLGGKINNGTNGTINIKRGGTLYNYYGEAEVGSGDIHLYDGGKFTNVRGTSPGTLSTLEAGGTFLDLVDISLDRDLDIDYTWTLTEKAVLKGNGHTINFGPEGGIEILGSTASLLLDDVIINGLSGTNIYCTDNNSTLSLHDVVWNQDNDVTFSFGTLHLNANGDWFIQGDGTSFIYSSNQTFSIDSNATMHIAHGTLEYDSGTSNKIELMDSTSKIHLENSTLKATSDCTLTIGKLYISGLGILETEATPSLNLEGLSRIEVNGAMHRIGTVIL